VRPRSLTLLFFFTVVPPIVAACVGDDPESPPATSPPDGASPVVDSGTPTDSPSGVTDTGAPDEAAPPPPCKLDQPFENPQPFEPLNSDLDDGMVRFSADGMTAYFSRGDFNLDSDIFVAVGPSFLNPVKLDGVNAPSCCADGFPSVSADSRELFTYANQTSPGTIYRSSRTLLTDAFANRALVPGLEAYTLIAPFLSYDGNSLYVRDLADNKLKQSQRVTGFQFNAPVEVFPKVREAVLSKDETTLYVYTDADGLSVATRAGKTGPFGTATKVAELASIGAVPNYLTPDGCRLYFTSGSSGAGKLKNNIWYADKPK
jgi:hypothetical protein